jgi:hypothetical protein
VAQVSLGWGGQTQDRCGEPAGDDAGKSELLHCGAFFFLQGLPMWLRLEGDSDDPNTWHSVKRFEDHIWEVDTVTVVFADGPVTVGFADGTLEKVFNGKDVRVRRPLTYFGGKPRRPIYVPLRTKPGS